MKLTKYPVLALTLALLVCSQFCFAENDTKSYSEQLEEAIRKAGRYLTGYKIVSEDIDKGLFPSPYFEKLCSKEVVPFLLDVIKNGPPGSSTTIRPGFSSGAKTADRAPMTIWIFPRIISRQAS